ncbi:MAG: hypothetical protein EXR28_14065 [Betaproteobacteria bacterium]|nr:hypothetical protein [Betaproteobacteria bacterium]
MAGILPLVILIVLFLFGRQIWNKFKSRMKIGGSDVPLAPLGEDFSISETDAISLARTKCREIRLALEQRLGDRKSRLLIYASAEHASRPWIHIDHLIPSETSSRLVTLEITFEPRPFRAHPVIMSVVINDSRKTRRYTSIYEISSAEIDNLCKQLMEPAESFKIRPLRLREFGWQLFRPKEEIVPLETPMSASMRGFGIFVLIALAFFSFAMHPIVGIAVSAGVFYFLVIHCSPSFRMTSGRPDMEPRALRRLDSWQTVVRDLGEHSAATMTRIRAALQSTFGIEAVGGGADHINVGDERIWYLGANGKSERDQVVVRLRRAIVFVHVYEYGSHLYVGWDAHLNQFAWGESAVAGGYAHNDGRKLNLLSVQTTVQPLNEYDLNDANFLLETVHAVVSNVLQVTIKEREIDQVLDFAIVRESRRDALEDSEEKKKPRRFMRTA